MNKKEVVAMLLAGGRGTRLKELTEGIAKPAVYFGGKYRIIDFPLSNCSNSGINTVGVLTQYEPFILNTYIGTGSPWDLDVYDGGIYVLPPYVDTQGGNRWYKGTANAIFHNIDFIEQFDPEHVMILSGDHIYKMNYNKFLNYHKEKDADVSISVYPVPWEQASRFGIMDTDDDGQITDFYEKPEKPKSNLASMGIYIFKWPLLKKYLTEKNTDFGGDIIPAMLDNNKKVFAYRFTDYWKDVGTIESYWKANMDLLTDVSELKIDERSWHIYSRNPNLPVQFVGEKADIHNSLVNEGCVVQGTVKNTVLHYNVTIGRGSVIKDSVILPGVKIGENVQVDKAIIGEGTIIKDNVKIGSKEDVTLIGNGKCIS
ncbi:MAG: glucose-1-phosphate adenylyltransferase [Halothermotrichaceae bacterium]